MGGRVGMNDTCYFTLGVKKLDSTLLYFTLLFATLLCYSLPPLFLTLRSRSYIENFSSKFPLTMVSD